MNYSYFVYILKCSDNSYYTGVTNDLDARLSEHQLGLNSKAYTYKKRPVELVYSLEFDDIYEAICFEKQIKGWTRKKKETIINDNWELLPDLSECKNSSHCKNHNKPKSTVMVSGVEP